MGQTLKQDHQQRKEMALKKDSNATASGNGKKKSFVARKTAPNLGVPPTGFGRAFQAGRRHRYDFRYASAVSVLTSF